MTAPGGQEIEPGKTQKLVVTLSTRYVKGDYTKDIEVENNDPSTPVLKLTIKMKMVEVLGIVPGEILFGTVKPGSLSTRMVTITNKGKDPLTITNISVNPSPVFSVSQQGKTKLEPGKSISVEVRLQPTQRTDSLFGLLHVETDLPNLQSKDARIRARVAAD
ncbi:MAG TPA: choice-of-anchor D domain-containing protein [Desulfomonilia bacterium]|nr:choice-of-anchor D domain-containing protein [Desulfomonilia bacterium]